MAKKSRRSSTKQPTVETATATFKPTAGEKGTWKLIDRGATIASGLLANRVAMVAWRGVTGKKPPTNGRHPEVNTGEAVAWAVVGGALVELVKVGVRRGATGYWVRSTGQLPPGMKPLVGPDPLDDEKPAPAGKPASKRRSRRGRG